MADSKTTALTENTAPALTDVMYIIDNPGGTPASQKVTLESLLKLINIDGWIPAGETWTYASADDPTFTFTISGVDLTTKYYAGMKIKLSQTTVKYFIITKVAFSTNTTVTVYGGTDYDLADAAITLPYYSTAKGPAGFPLDPLKWTVEATDADNENQSSPAQNTWYNIGTATISIPIGAWKVSYMVNVAILNATATSATGQTTLSTANNSESDADFSCFIAQYGASANPIRIYAPAFREKYLLLTSKTSYYLNGRSIDTGMDDIYFLGALGKTIIRAVCAYL